MADNIDTRDAMAYGRLEAAYEAIEETARDYPDVLSDADEERLKDALDAVGATKGSLMGASHVLEDVDEENIVLAAFNERTPDSGDAFWSEEASMLVGVKGEPSGQEVTNWHYHLYNKNKERDRMAVNDIIE